MNFTYFRRTAVIFTIPLLILILFTEASSAQTPYSGGMYIDVRWDRTDTIGMAMMRLEYLMRFPSENGPDSSHVDRRIVEIGYGLQREYSLILETSEMAGNYAWKQTDGAFTFDTHEPGSPVNPFELYITHDGITVIHKTMMLGPVLRWQEDTPAFEWQLTSDTCTVMGYPCQKAVTEFRGRVWHAWFCTSLPVNSGPYKFRGLPGLILKAEDTTGTYSWKLVAIERGTWPILEKRLLYQDCTRTQARKYIRQMFTNPYQWTVSRGIRVQLMDSRNHQLRELTHKEKSESFHYDPIELE